MPILYVIIFIPQKSVKNQEKAHDGMNKYFVMGFLWLRKPYNRAVARRNELHSVPPGPPSSTRQGQVQNHTTARTRGNQLYPPFGHLPRLGRQVLAALGKMNPFPLTVTALR